MIVDNSDLGYYGLGDFSDFGSVNARGQQCPVPPDEPGFLGIMSGPSTAATNAWCDCQYPADLDANLNAACKKYSPLGYPWTDVGASVRGLPKAGNLIGTAAGVIPDATGAAASLTKIAADPAGSLLAAAGLNPSAQGGIPAATAAAIATNPVAFLRGTASKGDILARAAATGQTVSQAAADLADEALPFFGPAPLVGPSSKMDGIPTWALVAGGAAVLGAVILAKKKRG